MSRKSLQDFKKELYELNPNLEVLSDEYINNDTKVKIRCNKHNYTWEVKPRTILAAGKCPVCSGYYVTDDLFKAKVFELNPNLPYFKNF